ncbi:MAG TPA: hypothetical protein VKM72_10070 [Thermoanaerobaculia bacterium]|nr:hypothetical protein [Thermoanaerobaculia bacterium]
MQVEHFITQSRSPSLRNRYSNCFLICRLCNLARGVALNRTAVGYSLLNPGSRSWLDAFEVIDDEIQSRNVDDGDAIYTRDTYDLNDPHKVRMRKLRRETIERALIFLQKSEHLDQKLIERAAMTTGDPLLLEAAETVKIDRRNACWELHQFLAVPHDHDKTCHCGHKANHSLPEALARQTIDVERNCAGHRNSGCGVGFD